MHFPSKLSWMHFIAFSTICFYLFIFWSTKYTFLLFIPLLGVCTDLFLNFKEKIRLKETVNEIKVTLLKFMKWHTVHNGSSHQFFYFQFIVVVLLWSDLLVNSSIEKRQYLLPCYSDKGLKGTVVKICQ